MSNPRARIAVIGAGIGGLAAAIALRRHGFHVDVYEQARQFRRVGAAINLTPNAVRVLDGLGLADAIRRTAHRPLYRISRTWDTGAVTSNVELGAAAEAKYGAPLLTLHRAERWRTELIENDEALTRWMDQHAGSDVQALRSLIRAARKDAAAAPEQRSGRAYRELFQFVRQTLDDEEAQDHE